ncbi:MAG: YigZ family protein [Neisseriaceae bacterium]|nr:MAG: YigZ family protein [Neisseriaceae bacterium]
MIDHFKTIDEEVFAEYKHKGSRFLAYAYPTQSIGEIKIQQDLLRKEHLKAVHVCYAYRLGFDRQHYRANDDGEPSGSAGLPILGQIDSYKLTNISIMVVRYFGGILLGVPGLVKAYKTVSKNVLSQAHIIEKNVYKTLTIDFDYSKMNEVMRLIQKTGSEIIERNLQSNCRLIVNIPLVEYNTFLVYFKDHFAVNMGDYE